jgi:hypothetical protein
MKLHFHAVVDLDALAVWRFWRVRRRPADEHRIVNCPAGPVVRHRHGLNERDHPGTETVDRDTVTRFDALEKLRPKVWRDMDFGSIGQDESVDIATGSQVVLRDDTMDLRHLRGIKGASCGLRECGSACHGNKKRHRYQCSRK